MITSPFLRRTLYFTSLCAAASLTACSDGGSTASSGAGGGSATGAGGSNPASGPGATSGGPGATSGGPGATSGSSMSTGGGTVVNHHCVLTPDTLGWVDVASNDANVQGAVYTYEDTSMVTTITPLTSDTQSFTNAGDGKLCIHGSASKIGTDPATMMPDYAKYFGAAMGIDLCHAGPNDAMPTTKYTLSTCPGGSKLVGVRFEVTGTKIPTELRGTFHEAGRDASTYVLLSAGKNTAMFADGAVLYDKTAPPVKVSDIDSFHVTIPTNITAAVDFDFCIEHVELLTQGGSCDMGDTGMMGGSSAPTMADVTTAYAAWKAAYVMSCGDGSSFVKKDSTTDAVSEGIGYGMLAAVATGDQATFDALYKFYNAHLDSHGLMNWEIGGCGNNVKGSNSATDGDLDAAMALVQATCKWPGKGYDATATSLISKIASSELRGDGSLKPGDTGFDGGNCVNPSYLAPGYFHAFAKFSSGAAATWNKAADQSYTRLNSLANATTGLVPNWSDGCPGYADAGIYGYDAARTPWRLATDFKWFGTAAASPILTKMVAWADKTGVNTLSDKYNLDGTVVAGSNFHTPVIVGALANATVVSDMATQDKFYQALKGVTVEQYFPATLKLLYQIYGAGMFDKCVQ